MSSELDSRNEVVDQQQAAEALTARRSLATDEQSNRALQITRTQARIGKWGDSCPAVQEANAAAYAWGDNAAVKAACDKLREEYEEFCKEPIGCGFDRELADVAIVVFRLAHLRGFDLLDAIEAKMLEVVAKHGGVWMDRDGKEHTAPKRITNRPDEMSAAALESGSEYEAIE